MKVKTIANAAALALSASILTTSAINASANTTVEDAMEMAYDDLETNQDIKNGVTIIENNDKPKIEEETIELNGKVELGDIVTLSGIGNSSADGSGKKTINYENTLAAIVSIDEDSDYPYALVKVYEDGSISNIIGWFKKDSIKSRYILRTITEYADVQQTIIDTEDIPEVEENSWEFLNEYYDYINGKSIQVKYIWPEVKEDYESVYTIRFENNVQTREYFDGEKYFYYDYNWKDGTITHSETEKDKLDSALILNRKDKQKRTTR